MCGRMGSHFPNWILELGHTFLDFLGVRQFFIFTVSIHTRMFVL